MIDCPSKIRPSDDILKACLLKKAQILLNDAFLSCKMKNHYATVAIDVNGREVKSIRINKEIIASA